MSEHSNGTVRAVCTLCDAHCGLRVRVDQGRVVEVRGDVSDPFTRGHICPKAAALGDLMDDPDRVRTPLKRVGRDFVPVSWEEALGDIGQRLAAIRARDGADAVATYLGNPTAHDYGAALASTVLRAVLGGRNHFSAASLDNLPRVVASATLFGSPAAVPVPDLDHTEHLLVIGANPLVSNGSGMVSPDITRRLRAIQERGGRIVVVDPRRTETAAIADQHHFIRPGSDAFLLLAMMERLFATGVAARSPFCRDAGFEALGAAVREFTAERVAARVGLPAATIHALADDLASARRAICYGRMGTCVQEHGTTTTILLDLVNALTGNLDREGGVRFATPAIDLVRISALAGAQLKPGCSRVAKRPSFLGELPVAALLEELEAPGPGQIKALIVNAGNPVLSNPDGSRVGAALQELDLLVSIDLFVNETSCLAHYILPTPVALERAHYPMLFAGQGVRNFASFDGPVVPAPKDTREGWDVLLELAERVLAARGLPQRAAALAITGLRRARPERILDLLLRVGPQRHRKLTLASLQAAGTTVDLGPLEARLGDILRYSHRSLDLFPALLASELGNLGAQLSEPVTPLVLISRRTLRSNNSWMHNAPRLMRGASRCTLEVHPTDAERCQVQDGAIATLRSDVGSVDVPVRVTDDIMPGVVCLPHGFGHGRAGTRLGVASAQPGASVNDVIDARRVDRLSGTSALSGQPVQLGPSARA
ncbi:MAG: molybdopterin-dependent oxidoreductase [Sandaracinaceae bacterium]|nr:molybdopterin-dependent oxidoreductase [Sandaracinaceae bacterium]